jgi:hypothetical protein
MAFERAHPFVKSCLEAIPEIYDPFDWGTIGPGMLSKLTKSHEHPPKIHPRVWGCTWDEEKVA